VGRTSKQFHFKFNITVRVSKAFRYPFNISGRVSLVFRYPFRIVQRTSKAFRYPFNIKQRISKQFRYPFNIVGRISKVFRYPFNIKARVSKQFRYKFNIKARISKVFRYPFNIIQRTSKTFRYPFNIKARVSKSFRYPFVIRHRVSKMFRYPFNISVRVSKTIRYPFNIKKRVSKVFRYVFNILALGVVKDPPLIIQDLLMDNWPIDSPPTPAKAKIVFGEWPNNQGDIVVVCEESPSTTDAIEYDIGSKTMIYESKINVHVYVKSFKLLQPTATNKPQSDPVELYQVTSFIEDFIDRNPTILYPSIYEIEQKGTTWDPRSSWKADRFHAIVNVVMRYVE